MKWSVILVPLVCLSLASEVLAQEEKWALIQEENRAPFLAPPEGSSPEVCSPRTAFWLSFLGSAVPIGGGLILSETSENTSPGDAAVFVGSLVGPSLGHFYAGRPGRAWLGIGVRVAALGAALLVINGNIMEEPHHGEDVLFYASLLTYCASGIIDIATAPGSAAKTNEESRLLFQGTRIRSTGDPALALLYRF